MATVHADSWDDFILQASRGSADTIIELPENAVWDMSEAGEKVQAINTYCGEIHGNGTEIQNLQLRTNFSFRTDGFKMSDLHFTNFLVKPSSYLYGTFLSVYGKGATFEHCSFSGIMQANSYYNFTQFVGITGNDSTVPVLMDRCAVNIETPSATFSVNHGNTEWKNSIIKATALNALRAHGGTDDGQYIGSKATHSEIIFSAPKIKTLKALQWHYCTLRGTLTGLETIDFSGQVSATDTDACSVYELAGMGQGVVINQIGTASLIGVTTAQMMNAEYLASLGFEIGVI